MVYSFFVEHISEVRFGGVGGSIGMVLGPFGVCFGRTSKEKLCKQTIQTPTAILSCEDGKRTAGRVAALLAAS